MKLKREFFTRDPRVFVQELLGTKVVLGERLIPGTQNVLRDLGLVRHIEGDIFRGHPKQK